MMFEKSDMLTLTRRTPTDCDDADDAARDLSIIIEAAVALN